MFCCTWCFDTAEEADVTEEINRLGEGLLESTDGSPSQEAYGTTESIGKVLCSPVKRVKGYECKGFVNSRGLELWEQKFLPMDRNPIGVVIFFHDLQEHSERYNILCKELVGKANVAMYSFDMQSHGKSEDVRGIRSGCNNFEEFVQDGKEMIERVRQDFKDLPLFLWGHGFGGLVVSNLLSTCDITKEECKGAILSAPNLMMQVPFSTRLQIRAADVASRMTPDRLFVPTPRAQDIFQDFQAVESYNNDPLVNKDNVTCRITSEIFKAQQQVAEKVENFQAENLLILFGEQDKCADIEQARIFYELVNCSTKEFKSFEHMPHGLFHQQPESQPVIDYFAEWLGKNLNVTTDVITLE